MVVLGHFGLYIYIYFGFAEDFRFIIFLSVYLIELDKSLLGNKLGTLVSLCWLHLHLPLLGNHLCTLLSLISHSLVTTWEPWFLHFFQIFFFFLVCRRIQIHYISSLLCFLFHILPFSLFFILILI